MCSQSPPEHRSLKGINNRARGQRIATPGDGLHHAPFEYEYRCTEYEYDLPDERGDMGMGVAEPFSRPLESTAQRFHFRESSSDSDPVYRRSDISNTPGLRGRAGWRAGRWSALQDVARNESSGGELLVSADVRRVPGSVPPWPSGWKGETVDCRHFFTLLLRGGPCGFDDPLVNNQPTIKTSLSKD
jgi:hypothetical protein